MGCEAARELEHDSESNVTRVEGAIGFSGLSASFFASTTKSFSRKREVRLKDLRRVLAAVDMPTGFLDTPTSPLYLFFRLHSTKRNFSVRVLSTLGTLLGCDPPQAKAQVLFNTYDDHAVGKLGPREIYEMTNTACKVALLYVPRYVELVLRSLRDLEGLKKHQTMAIRLEKRVPLLTAHLSAALLQGLPVLSESEFAVHLQQHCPSLLTAASLRQQALSLSDAEAAAFKPQLPAGFEPQNPGDTLEEDEEEEEPA